MAVRETLELDIRKALQQANELGAAYTAQLKKAGEGLEQGLGGSTAKLEAGAAAAGKIGTGLRGAGDGAAAAASGFAQLGPKADEAAAAYYRYKQKVDETRESERKSNDERRQSEESFSKVGIAAGIAGASIAAGIGLAINASMGFDSSMSMVGAVSGATAEQMGRLRQAALDAGAATIFSAKDAADAEGELAKAGISVSDILNGALMGSLDLAAAGQLELGRSAEIAAQAMQIFSLKGTDVSHIADVFAAAANKSTGSVESLAQGLENVGGVAAKLFGLSLEETVGTLALFDQNALRGAEGGNALRSALMALATPTDQQREAMKAVNLEVYDAQGNFVGLSQLAGNLQTSFQGATEEQRNLALGIIFGSYGIRAANVLYQEGEEGVRKWTEAVDDQGAAARFSGTLMDNLAGDMENLQGSIETALIGAGSQGNDVLRFMAQRATDAVNGIAELPGPMQAAGLGMGGLLAAGLGLVFVLGTMIPKWHEVQDALRASGSAGEFAAEHMGKIARVGAGLTGAIVSFQMIGKSTESSAMGIAGMAAAGAAIGSVFPGYGTAIGAAAGATLGFAKAMFGGGESAEEFAKKIEGLTASLNGLGAAKSATVFLEEIGETATEMGLNFRAADLDQREFLKAGGVAEFKTTWADAGKQVDEYYTKFAALAKKNPAQAEMVLDGLRKIRDENGKLAIPDDVIDKMEKQLKRGQDAYVKTSERTKETTDANKGLLEQFDVTGQAAEAAAQQWEDYVGALSNGTPTIVGLFDEAAKAVEDWQNSNSPEVLLANLQKQQEGVAAFTGNVKFLMDAGLTDLAALVAQKGPIAGGALAQALRDATPETLAALNGTIQGANTELTNWNTYLKGPLAEALRGTSFGMGFGVGTGTAEGVAGSTPQATTAATALTDAAKWILGTLPDAGKAAGEGAGSGTGSGIESKKGDVEGSARVLVDTAMWTLGQADGHPAGENVGEGFAQGIWGKAGRVVQAAASVGASAVRALAAATESQSPSRAAMRIGAWTGEGFALGMMQQEGSVRSASARLAEVAMGGLGSTSTGGKGGGDTDSAAAAAARALSDKIGRYIELDNQIAMLQRQLTAAMDAAKRATGEQADLAMKAVEKIQADIRAATAARAALLKATSGGSGATLTGAGAGVGAGPLTTSPLPGSSVSVGTGLSGTAPPKEQTLEQAARAFADKVGNYIALDDKVNTLQTMVANAARAAEMAANGNNIAELERQLAAATQAANQASGEQADLAWKVVSRIQADLDNARAARDVAAKVLAKAQADLAEAKRARDALLKVEIKVDASSAGSDVKAVEAAAKKGTETAILTSRAELERMVRL